MLNLHFNIFVSLFDDDLAYMCFVDEFIVESVLVLEYVSEWFARVVEVCLLVGEAEFVVYAVGWRWQLSRRESQEHLHAVGVVCVGSEPPPFPCFVDGEWFDGDIQFRYGGHCQMVMGVCLKFCFNKQCLWLEGDAFGSVDECGVVEAAEVVAEFLLSCVLECVEELVDVLGVEFLEFHGCGLFVVIL